MSHGVRDGLAGVVIGLPIATLGLLIGDGFGVLLLWLGGLTVLLNCFRIAFALVADGRDG